MSISPYFTGSSKGHVSEQSLVESLQIESIKICGQDVIYIPRSLNKFDRIFGEDVLSSFDSYAEIEMWTQDFSGFSGASEILSKFGMEIQNTASFIVARKRFVETVSPIYPDSRNIALRNRPCEGDLIYMPNTRSMFEIKFVEDEEPGFYQLNKKYVWTLRCESVNLNNEKFQTGHVEIDTYFGPSMNRLNMAIITESGDRLLTESGGIIMSEDYSVDPEYDDLRSFGDNTEIKKEFLDIMNFDEKNPFME